MIRACGFEKEELIGLGGQVWCHYSNMRWNILEAFLVDLAAFSESDGNESLANDVSKYTEDELS